MGFFLGSELATCFRLSVALLTSPRALCLGYAVGYICAACGTKTSEKSPGWCRCGLDNAWIDDVGLDPTAPRRSAAGGLVRADALDVRSVRRHATGSPFDTVLGGGIPEGACLLIWGRSGSGKTRLAIQLCARLTPAVLVSLEMPEEQSLSIISELDIPSRNVWLTRERNWRSVALAVRPRLVVVDSVSVFGHPGAVEDETRLSFEWAHEHGVTVALVCHATSDGKAKGGSGPVHWSDAAIVVKARGRGLVSVDTPAKNRYGATGPGRPVGRGRILKA